MVEFDVAIAGSGPAGSTLALRLARAGLRVALVEARRFPRHKPCGEYMSPQVLPMLAELGLFERVRALEPRCIRGMQLSLGAHSASGRYVEIGAARPPFSWGWAVRRERFDAALRDGALAEGGVELFDGWRVRDLLRDGEGRVLGLTAAPPRASPRQIRARFTVGADGVRSTVARALGARRERAWLDRLALVTRYRGPPPEDCARAELTPEGFFALAPVDGGLWSLNLVVRRDAYLAAGLGPAAFLEGRIERTPRVARFLAGAVRVEPVRGVGPLSTWTRAQAFDGAALVGDAAGYVDPITGEGIYLALRGSELLARALLDALARGRTDAAALESYVRGRARHVRPHERAGLALQRVLAHPRLARAGLRTLERRPGLADLVVSAAGDYAPLAALASPRVWWRALRREPLEVRA